MYLRTPILTVGNNQIIDGILQQTLGEEKTKYLIRSSESNLQNFEGLAEKKEWLLDNDIDYQILYSFHKQESYMFDGIVLKTTMDLCLYSVEDEMAFKLRWL